MMIYECRACGAAVVNIRQHVRWHGSKGDLAVAIVGGGREEVIVRRTSDLDSEDAKQHPATAPEALLNPTQVATELSLSRSSVYAMLASGEIRSVKIGRSRRIPRSEIARYIDSLTDTLA